MTVESANPARGEFLAQLRALSGLVLIGSVPGVLKAEDLRKYGADEMPDGWSDNPLAFVAIGSDGVVTIVVHRSEMGQGVRTGMPLIVADELEADWSKVRVTQAPADEEKHGNQDADESRSPCHFFEPMRRCGAAARTMLEQAAAETWDVPVTEVQAVNHEVVHRGSGRKLGYGILAERAAKLAVPPRDSLRLKSPSQFRYTGEGKTPLADEWHIATGKAQYGIDTRLDASAMGIVGLMTPAFAFELLAAATVYFATAELGLRLAFLAKQVSLVWPASGVALALLVLRGRRLWPAILFGAFGAYISNQTPIGPSAGIAVGDTAEALLGATLLLRVDFQPALRRLHDVASLFLLVACLSTIVGATVDVTTVCLVGIAPWREFTSLWSTWWIGDGIGDLVTAAFVFVWVDQARRGWRLDRLTEALLLLTGMLVLSLAVFVDDGANAPYPIHYLIFPAVIWAAMRLGQHATSTLVIGAMSVAICATLQGRGPFVTATTENSLLQVTVFIAVVAVTGFVLGAAIAERNRAERRRSADYARLRLSEERLARQAEELATADRRKDEFLAVLGHELRNPLAPLKNGLELLALAGTDPAVLARTRALMERQVRHLVRLVDDLLDVARIRSGKIVLELERVELAPMVTSAVEIVRPVIDARRHELEVILPDRPMWIEADRTRLPQLFANLLNNAAKYTAEGGRITLNATERHGVAVVSVRDSGIGMTPEALTEIFELFAQAVGPKHAVQGGLGVGLSLARSIAELHRGMLTAHSEGLGRGSEFVLRLPMAPAPSLPEASADPSHAAATRRRVLVVDDNIDAAESLGMMLTYLGHDARVVNSGHDAIEVAREFSPDVMILDLGMPEMDGYAVARAMRANPALARTRLIALSGYGQPNDRRRTAEAGFDEHLVKPVERDILATAFS